MFGCLNTLKSWERRFRYFHSLFITVPFNWDNTFGLEERHQSKTKNRTYRVANVRVVSDWVACSSQVRLCVVSRISMWCLTSVHVFCKCCTRHIGHMRRWLSKRMTKHVSACPREGTIKAVDSKIPQYLFDNWHQIDSVKGFKLVLPLSRINTIRMDKDFSGLLKSWQLNRETQGYVSAVIFYKVACCFGEQNEREIPWWMFIFYPTILRFISTLVSQLHRQHILIRASSNIHL